MSTPAVKFAERIARSRRDLGQRRIHLEIPRTAGKEPFLAVDPPVRVDSKAIGRVSLFTNTTKMRCASFSLPAGPPKVGGTCPAAALVPPKGEGEQRFVCYGCYATTGNYLLPSVQAVQSVRREWIARELRAGRLVASMTRAIEHQLSTPRRGVVIGAGGERSTVAMNASFFRIHDSGDFSWAGPGYLMAWMDVAQHFAGRVTFWAPSRDWTFPRMRDLFARLPPNLVIRPSAFYVDEPPPSVPGMPAGATVALAHPQGFWDCPAYRSAEHSCESAGCRVCWTHPTTPINYAPHGAIEKSALVRANPLAPLASLLGAFASETGHLRGNPSHGQHQGEGDVLFEAWLGAHGKRPADFSEKEWKGAMGAAGIDDPAEQLAYLEGMAEWQ